MAAFEYSAGAFIFLPGKGNAFRLLILDRGNGEYDIPKGHIEKGETSERAAVREIREETGIDAQLVPYFHADTHYFFKRNGETISKNVRFFVSIASNDRVKISNEHIGYEWLDIEGFRKKIKFKDILEILPNVIGYYERHARMQAINKEYALLPVQKRGWGLSRTLVPGEGPLNAEAMLVGQAPGRFEDEQRRPFIGRSGKLLDEILRSAKLKRRDLYITSVVQFFPPKNRIPTRNEITLCRGFLLEQMNIIKPRFVVLMGNVALEAVLGMKSVHAHHGSMVKKEGRSYMITLHPAAALRFRESKRIMQQDFAKFGKAIAAKH